MVEIKYCEVEVTVKIMFGGGNMSFNTVHKSRRLSETRRLDMLTSFT